MKKFFTNPVFILVIGLVVLLLTQQKIVMPLVNKVIESDLFLVQSNDEASQLPISSALTDIAYKHCNQHVKNKLGADAQVSFSDKPTNVWSMGNYQYVVSAELKLKDKASGVDNSKKYVCRITYADSDDQKNINEFGKWNLLGIDGL